MRVFKSLQGWLRRLYDHPYNRQRPITAMVRLFRWHALQLSGCNGDFSFWGTRTIRCYPDADGSMWLLLNEIMDWNEFHFIRCFVRPNDIFLDIGANVGIYTLWASQFIDTRSSAGRIVAFEPDPANFLRLGQQIALNRLEAIEIVPVALSDKTGSIRFSQGKDGMNHILIGPPGESSIEVPTMTLDVYCAEKNIPHIDFVKIDVEGAEQLVLAGARRLLAAKKVDVIQIEFNEQVHARALEESKLLSILREFEYDLYRFTAATGELHMVPYIDFQHHENLFAIHDISAVRRRLAENAHAMQVESVIKRRPFGRMSSRQG
jgi:FkbM family methyltransferase